MKKLLTTLILSSCYSFAQADCMFKILNYSDSAVTTTIGFYGANNNKTFIVAPADTAIEHFKSDYECNSVGAGGLGKAFVQFPKDPGYGGANYSPENDRITLMGKFNGNSGGREILADNGTPLWLNTMNKPMESAVFEIKLNSTGHPNSLSAGTQ